MRNTAVAMRLLSRSAPIALFAIIGAGCSSDVARFSDPFANPFKSRPQAYAQQAAPTYQSVPSYAAASRSSALPSADDVVRRAPRAQQSVQAQATQPYGQAQQTYNQGQQIYNQGQKVYNQGQQVYNQGQQAYGQAQSAYSATQQVNRAKSAIPTDWQSSKALPFSAENADAGLTTSGIAKKAYQWKPGTPYLKQMMKPKSETQSNAGGWTKAGGTAVRIAQGDTIQLLSNRYGVPASAIAQSNGLMANQPLNPGQSLIIPTYTLGAVAQVKPVKAAQPSKTAPLPHQDGDITASIPQRPKREAVAGAPLPQPNSSKAAWLNVTASAQPKPAYHTVAMGDSVASIAKKHNISVDDLARRNGLGPDNPIRIGQNLKLPTGHTAIADKALQDKAKASVMAAKNTAAGKSADKITTASIARPAAAKPVVAAVQAVKPQPEKVVARVEEPVAPVTQPSPSVTMSTATPDFRWPVKGRVIGNFVPNQRDGIALSVPEGTSVRAAADGTVAYSGNELKGYGNVILIRHSGGYVSAYAHNSELLVKRGDSIKRGQVISLSGQSGGVSSPQLHFEIRKGQDAVNPMAYLKN